MSGEADPIADWAASGVPALTGRADGPPLLPPGRAATIARELSDRIAAATRGTVCVDGAQLLAERAALTGATRRGRISTGGSCRLLPTADGWAAVSCARPGDPALLGALIGRPVDDDPWPAVTAWSSRTPGAELAARAELLGVPATAVDRPPNPGVLTKAHGRSSGPVRSVEGLRVVDFSALWAGPLAASLLGLAGAEVIKVETPQRLDGARRGNPDFYRLLHAGHRAVLLDPGSDRGRAALAALVASADVVIEASRPRALAGFGLDAEAAAGAGTTWISITAAGRRSNRIGFGDDVAAGAGLVAVDTDRTPVFVGDAIADPLTGLTAAALALTTPAGGRLLDLAMADVVAGTLEPAESAEPSVPSPTARRASMGWVLEGRDGAHLVAPPAAREVAGGAPEPGADTDVVLAGL